MRTLAIFPVLICLSTPALAETPAPVPAAEAEAARALKEKQRQAKIQMAELGKGLDLYYQDCGSYPRTEDGLSALQRDLNACKRNWGPEPYVKNIPNDPWGRPYIYWSDGYNNEMKSYGADGREGGTGEDADVKSVY